MITNFLILPFVPVDGTDNALDGGNGNIAVHAYAKHDLSIVTKLNVGNSLRIRACGDRVLAVGDKLIVTQSYGMQGAEKASIGPLPLPEIAFVQWSWRIVPQNPQLLCLLRHLLQKIL